MSAEKQTENPNPKEINRLIHAPARLVIMKLLYVLDGADMVFLKRETHLSWGNLSVQVRKLEEAGYVLVEKEFVENKPHTLVSLTQDGQSAFRTYCTSMKIFLE